MLTRIQKVAFMSRTCNRQSLVWCCVCIECSKDIPPQHWAEHTHSKSPFFRGPLHIWEWMLHSVSAQPSACLEIFISVMVMNLWYVTTLFSWTCHFGKLLEDKAHTRRHGHSGWMKGWIHRETKHENCSILTKLVYCERSNRKSTMVKRLEESSFWLTVNIDRQREWFQDSWASKLLKTVLQNAV